jgi:hypothetical protein
MDLKKRLKNLISEEQGNSTVEFALVLPMLIVLTVGGIYLSVSFGQKAVMNGVNFMEVRAGSVHANPPETARKAMDLYLAQAENKQRWLERAEVLPQPVYGKANNGMTDFRVSLAKEGMKIDLLLNSLRFLSGKKPELGFSKITSTMTLPIEYVTHKTASGSVSDHSETYSVVDYETKTGLDEFMDKLLLDKLSGEMGDKVRETLFQKLVDPKKINGIHDSKQADRVVGTNPQYNMNNVKKAYGYWGLEFEYPAKAKNSEQPKPGGFNSLFFLQKSGEHAHAIKNGAALAGIALSMTGALAGAEAVLGPMSKAAEVVEFVGDKVGRYAETNNKFIFRKGLVGAP